MIGTVLYTETLTSPVRRLVPLLWLGAAILSPILLARGLSGHDGNVERALFAVLVFCLAGAVWFKQSFSDGSIIVAEGLISVADGFGKTTLLSGEVLSWREATLRVSRTSRFGFVLEDEELPDGPKVRCLIRPNLMSAFAVSADGVLVRSTKEVPSKGVLDEGRPALFIPTQDPQGLCGALARMKAGR